MAVVALNPIHVQMSRMAYYYPPCVLGAFIAIGCIVESCASLRERRPLHWWFHVANACAVLLLFYASAGAWPLAAITSLFHVVCAVVNRIRHRTGWTDLVVMGVVYAVVGVPLLVVPWGLKAILAMTGDNQTTDYWRKIFEETRRVPIFSQIGYEMLKLGWGWTPARATLGGAVLVAGVVLGGRLVRERRHWGVLAVLLLVGLTLAAGALKTSVWEFALRRVSALWPLCFVVLAAGLYAPWEATRGVARLQRVRWVGLAPMVAGFGLWIHADALVTRVNGFDVPYRQIVNWLDRTFPRGTPVVTDRFYTAMCEFNRSHPPTNVVVVSTVPNELPEIQEKTRFRAVTQRYLEENPDTVFYCGNHLYGRPGIVPWEWPAQHFRQHHDFVDAYAWRLGFMGQNYFIQHLHLREPRPSTVYYNTIEDMIAIARLRKEDVFVCYGPAWRPVQTQDYRLWRMMTEDKASVTVHNVTTNPVSVKVTLQGVSVGGRSKLEVGSARIELAPNQIVEQQVPLTLLPGANVVSLRRSGSEQGRLLVGRIEVAKHE
jgi:hypothetical protein